MDEIYRIFVLFLELIANIVPSWAVGHLWVISPIFLFIFGIFLRIFTRLERIGCKEITTIFIRSYAIGAIPVIILSLIFSYGLSNYLVQHYELRSLFIDIATEFLKGSAINALAFASGLFVAHATYGMAKNFNPLEEHNNEKY